MSCFNLKTIGCNFIHRSRNRPQTSDGKSPETNVDPDKQVTLEPQGRDEGCEVEKPRDRIRLPEEETSSPHQTDNEQTRLAILAKGLIAALELHRIANEGKGLTQEEQNVLAAMLQSLVAVLEPSGSGNNEKGRIGHEPDHIGRRVYGKIGMPIVCNKSTSVIEPSVTESVLASESVQTGIGNVDVDPALFEPVDPIP